MRSMRYILPHKTTEYRQKESCELILARLFLYAKKGDVIMSIIAIESALDVAIMFNDVDMIAIYKQALADASVEYVSTAKCWIE